MKPQKHCKRRAKQTLSTVVESLPSKLKVLALMSITSDVYINIRQCCWERMTWNCLLMYNKKSLPSNQTEKNGISSGNGMGKYKSSGKGQWWLCELKSTGKIFLGRGHFRLEQTFQASGLLLRKVWVITQCWQRMKDDQMHRLRARISFLISLTKHVAQTWLNK